jgi:hypothetical protein
MKLGRYLPASAKDLADKLAENLGRNLNSVRASTSKLAGHLARVLGFAVTSRMRRSTPVPPPTSSVTPKPVFELSLADSARHSASFRSTPKNSPSALISPANLQLRPARLDVRSTPYGA